MDEYKARVLVPEMLIKLDDIRDVYVDTHLPKQEGIAEFVRQVKDPYHFRCGKFVVITRFADDGPTLEECLQ